MNFTKEETGPQHVGGRLAAFKLYYFFLGEKKSNLASKQCGNNSVRKKNKGAARKQMGGIPLENSISSSTANGWMAAIFGPAENCAKWPAAR
jgi:hypothetical protein